jgi:anthranilate phosphoribosyltransferase
MSIFATYLKQSEQPAPFNKTDMVDAMSLIMNGDAGAIEIGQFLTNLSKRGESAEEIAGAATILRSMATTINAPGNAIDCCGTGGDGADTFNISTAVALVSAACGVPVAKHGNRAASSKSGAADVLEYLGVNLTSNISKLETALQDIGFCFMMASNHHQAMKRVSSIRKELGFRTIFNLLGPLVNPAGTKRQLIGVFDKKWILPLAQALNNLGTEKAWIVHGSDGLDEITLTGETYVAILENGEVTETVITPEDFGLPYIQSKDIVGGDARENAEALTHLLRGQKNAYRDIVLANAAAVLLIAGKVDSLPEGVDAAARAIDSGAALTILNRYKELVA